MSALRRLERLEFETPAKPSAELGARGELKWIALDKIVIDPAYQRDVRASGKRNIKQIIENFRWSVFSPLVVAPREGGLYAAIDGQHRALAAFMHGGIAEVPCLVIASTPEDEAMAFAVINGRVTALHSQALFRARVVAREALALRVVKIAAAAGVTILPNPQGGEYIRPGECNAPTSIGAVAEWLGDEIAVRACECVTRTGENAGLLKGSVIEAFAHVLASAPRWAKDKRLFAVIEAAGVAALWGAALKAQATSGGSRRGHMIAVVTALLLRRLGACETVALPPTPASLRREAALKARIAARAESRAARRAARERERQARKRDEGAADLARAAAAQRVFATAPKAEPKPKTQDVRQLIDAHISKKGVTKVPEAATANPLLLTDYLKGKGFDVAYVQKTRQCRIGKKLYDLAGLIAFVARERAKDEAAARKLEKAG